MSEAHLPQRAQLRLQASWQRSQDYGVSVEEVDPLFAGTFDDESLFFECGREALAGLLVSLPGEPVSLMLTDPDGLVLSRVSGDPSLLRALDAVHLAPGFAYAERTVGTNGLGLALADRSPTLVRSAEHYALSLRGYTCAAVPVLDPATGRVEGCINLTTWSEQGGELLLALAQSAASTTSALMVARSSGGRSRPPARGHVFRVEAPRLEPGSGTVDALSPPWQDALAEAAGAARLGRGVVAVGETGAGRSTLLAQALRRVHPRGRVLAASPPAPQDSEAWLGLWTPELGKPDTAVLLRDADQLPTWVAEHVRDLVLRARVRAAATGAGSPTFALTSAGLDTLPAALVGLADAVVVVPPLRDRADDVMPLARHAARRARGREVAFTPSAENALRSCGWPGNVGQLIEEATRVATRTDVVDVRHLSADVLSGSTRRLSRIEAFERDEIVRVLARGGVSVQEAAAELGMSRATVYRKLAQYDIHLPRAGR
ncbi:helix-turn-helix domain-containing protein [Nocardioides zeicaulis]|uniref:Helix-turn-helix domain-containing protein n=1 Tax=Nocardioides zeicaulis TaxID=1776857 RepID=A0ABV6E4I7_9ACTN